MRGPELGPPLLYQQIKFTKNCIPVYLVCVAVLKCWSNCWYFKASIVGGGLRYGVQRQ